MSQRTTEGKASRGGSNGGVPRLEQGSLDAALASYERLYDREARG